MSRPARLSRRPRAACRRELAASATGITATPGSGMRHSRSTPSCASAYPKKPNSSCTFWLLSAKSQVPAGRCKSCMESTGGSKVARRSLADAGVKVLVNSEVRLIDADGVIVHDRRIYARTVLWAAGVAASTAAKWLNSEADKAGRVKVQPDLSVARSEERRVGKEGRARWWPEHLKKEEDCRRESRSE